MDGQFRDGIPWNKNQSKSTINFVNFYVYTHTRARKNEIVKCKKLLKKGSNLKLNKIDEIQIQRASRENYNEIWGYTGWYVNA